MEKCVFFVKISYYFKTLKFLNNGVIYYFLRLYSTKKVE